MDYNAQIIVISRFNNSRTKSCFHNVNHFTFFISRRRKEYKPKSTEDSQSDEIEDEDTSNVLSENDIRLRSKRINEDNSDS